jgi:hypothetical protein
MDSNTCVAERIYFMPTRLRRSTARRTRGGFRRLFLSVLCGTCLLLSLPEVTCADGSLTPLLPPSLVTSSTVPPNGDVNPYGVAFVPQGFPRFGTIGPGDLLVSNFNNKANLQGTGSTIVKIVPNSKPVVFFQGGAGLGLSTALGVLKAGFVLVGNVPTTDGTSATVKAGSLLVLNRTGNLVAQWTPAMAKIDGPWDLTIFDAGNTAKVNCRTTRRRHQRKRRAYCSCHAGSVRLPVSGRPRSPRRRPDRTCIRSATGRALRRLYC